MTPDERADALAALAQQLAGRVRDDDPADVHRWLASTVPDGEWMGLAVVLACAVPVDRPWRDLVGWVTWPHGVPARPLRCYRADVDHAAVVQACRGEPVALSRRERQLAVRTLLGRGLSRTSVARTLGLHPRTVRRLANTQPAQEVA